MDDSKEQTMTLEIAPLRLKRPHRVHSGNMAKGESRNLGGRPPGSLNKITRTLKDALIAAAVELGQLPLSQWEAELEKPDSDGMKHFFKVAAVREMKTFLTVVARIMPLHMRLKRPHRVNSGNMVKGESRNLGGRPPGSLNKITRTLKDALIAAAVELGQLPLSQWEAELEKPDSDGMKHFFKVAAVKEMKTFLTVVARIMPLHIQTSGTTPTYLTRDQMIERLREAGLPESVMSGMKPIDARTLDPEDLGYDPYDDPDEETMVDVTPKSDVE
jgi:hypothetical protein